MILKSENDLRKYVADNWIGWSDWVEPRGNAAIGFPDWVPLVDNIIVPIELKLGHCDGENILVIPKMRPDQISWHHRFRQFGGKSYWLVLDDQMLWFARKLVAVEGSKRYRFEEVMGLLVGSDQPDFSHWLLDYIRCWRTL